MFKNMEQLFHEVIRKYSNFGSGSKILMLLMLSPNKEIHVRDLAKKSKCSLGSTSRILNKMEKTGLLVSRTQGSIKLFKADWDSVTLKQFKIFLNALVATKLLSKIFALCKEIILFGSWAKGTNTFESDIDVFIETDKKGKVQEEMKKIDAFVSAQIMNSLEFIELKRKSPDFARNIEEGIVLWKEEA